MLCVTVIQRASASVEVFANVERLAFFQSNRLLDLAPNCNAFLNCSTFFDMCMITTRA